MLKNRRIAAQGVAEQLFAAEVAIDAAISATAALTGLMPKARQDAGVAAEIGQDALLKASETLAMLVRARAQIVETHGALAVAQRDMGLGAVNFGGLVSKVADPAASRHLTPVAAAHAA